MTKTQLLLTVTTIVFCIVASGCARPPMPEFSRVELKVIKVFSARDGDAVFHAYLVNWKDQDVVVDDGLTKTDYHVGDTIPVLVTKVKANYPGAKPGSDILAFSVNGTN